MSVEAPQPTGDLISAQPSADLSPIPPSVDGNLSRDLTASRNVPAWRRLAIGGIAFVGGLAAAGSAPALANGFKIEPGGANATAECSDDPNIMIINRDYADKIASGEIVIASKGVLAAAGYEGDKTAEGKPVDLVEGQLQSPAPQTPAPSEEPKTAVMVSVEEALKNLIISAPECPPVVEPTPFDGTVYMEAEINQNLDQIDTAVNFGTLTDDNDDLFATDAPWKEELASLNFWYPDDPSHPLKQKPWDTSLNTIKNGNPDLIKQHQSQKNIDKSKLDEVVGHAVEMAWVAQNATNPELIAELTTDIDHVIDYGAVGIYGKTVKGITKALGIIRSFFPGYANYLQ